MKYIVTTDTHIGRKNGNTEEIENTKDFFKWLIKKSKELGVYNLVHLGDFFHNRRSISVPVIVSSMKIIDEINENFNHSYIITGNHDIYYKNSIDPTSLELLCRDNVEIIKEPIAIDNILFIPWLVDDIWLEDIKNNSFKTDFAMGHLGINNIIMNKSKVKSQNDALYIKDFKNYKSVLSGHYHQYGVYDNIVYIASPYHMDFNDFGERGIYVFDSDTGDMEFIEYTGAPKYYVMDAEDLEEDNIEGNHIRLEFYNNIGLNKINEILTFVDSLCPESMKVSYKFANEFTRDEEFGNIIEMKTNRDILVDYIKNSNVPKNLNMKTLENIIDSLEKIDEAGV